MNFLKIFIIRDCLFFKNLYLVFFCFLQQQNLLGQGLKRKNICLELDISIKTYKRDIQFLKEQGLI